MKLDYEFTAGSSTSEIFRRLLSALEDRIRLDLTQTLKAFRDKIHAREYWTNSTLWDEFRMLRTKAAKEEIRLAKRFLIEENIPNNAKDKKSAVNVALHKAHLAEQRTKRECGYAYPDPPEVKAAAKRWHEAYDAVRAEEERYYNRQWFPCDHKYRDTELYPGEVLPSEKLTAELVEEKLKDLFDQFVAKQTGKVDEIVDGRAGTVAGVVEDTVWEAYLHFDLADRTHFEMKMQIKSVTNSHGTHFFQYSTTFHNAKKPDGEKVWCSEANLKWELSGQK
jgi:hypothetical protein